MNLSQRHGLPAHLIVHLPYFAAVARTQSFTLAAQQLHVSQSAVSYHLKQLEEKLALTLLLRRSGSRLHLTTAGKLLAQEYQACDQRLRTVLAQLQPTHLTGDIQLTAPVDFASCIMPSVLAKLCQQAPDLNIRLHVSDELVDLAASDFDFAIRSLPAGQHLQHTALPAVAKSLVASPAYLQQRGTPSTIAELAQHSLLVRGVNAYVSWNQLLGLANLAVQADWETVVLGNSFALAEGAKAGLGIAFLADFVITAAVQRGELQRVLPQHTAPLSTTFYLSHAATPQTQAVHTMLHKLLVTTLSE